MSKLKTKNMSWLCINEDNTECISNNKPFRAEDELNDLVARNKGYEMYRYKCVGIWADDFSVGHYNVPRFNGVVIPSGTIKKLIGIEIKWENEPIEYK